MLQFVPFRTALTGQSSARCAAFAVLALVGVFTQSAPAQSNPGDSVLSGIQIHKVNIVFPQLWNGAPGDTASWTSVRATLLTNKQPGISIPAKLEINCDATKTNPGCVVMDSVGVRYKGNSTFRTSQKKNPFRISFDEYGIDQRWNGTKGFILNNAKMDPSHMAEKIHMDFAVERAGMPGPRFAYADVYVNGFPYSFYLLGELADGRLLNNFFGEKDGDFFKAMDGISNSSDFTLASVSNNNRNRYEYKGDSADRAWSRLGAVVTAVNGANAATALPALVNVNAIYRAFATDVLFGSTDSYMHAGQNYLVYFPEAAGSKMEWVLWDASLSFGKASFGKFNSSRTPGGNCATAATGNILCGPTNKPLINKIVTTQVLREDYIRSFWFLYKAYFEGDWLAKRIDSVAGVIRPYLEADRLKIGVANMTTFDSNVVTLKSFVANRQVSVNSQFVTHRISAANAIRNTDIVINEIAPTQGWIEVYNNRQYAIDLSGHSLSNDSTQPNKWTFTLGSFIQPGEHRKIRLQGGQGTDTATNFTLSATGGHLRLSRANGTVVDAVTFGTVASAKSYARATDGTGAFREADPTPGAANSNTVAPPDNIAAGVVRINEIMADNDTTASPATIKADWVELYNTTSVPVSLAGRHLSDTPNNPAKWTFPSGTTIPANG